MEKKTISWYCTILYCIYYRTYVQIWFYTFLFLLSQSSNVSTRISKKLLKYEWIWIGRIEHNNILKYVLNYVATGVHQAL